MTTTTEMEDATKRFIIVELNQKMVNAQNVQKATYCLMDYVLKIGPHPFPSSARSRINMDVCPVKMGITCPIPMSVSGMKLAV